MKLIGTAHGESAKRPIKGPDENGAFPARGLPLPRGDLPPVIVDANVLRNDVLYACLNKQRTVLVSSANAGAIRLYAASHVIDEVAEHRERWSQESDGVSPQAFEARWRSEYLPLIREVDDEELPLGLLSIEERARVEELDRVDPDDAPSVVLCLILGGFFLSEDPAALRAVYGEGLDLEAHHAWVEILKSGGDANQLGALLFAAGAIPIAAMTGLLGVGRWVAKRVSPPVLLATGLGLIPIAKSRLPDTKAREQTWDGLAEVGAGLLYAYSLYQQADLNFRRATVKAPSWGKLCETNEAEITLKRGCLYVGARSRNGQMSTPQMSAALTSLGLGENPGAVEEVLKNFSCFLETGPDHWQVGAPAA